MKAASFLAFVLPAAGLTLALAAGGVASAPQPRSALAAQPRDGYYFATGHSHYAASVSAGKLVLFIFPTRCTAPGVALEAGSTIAVSSSGSFSYSGGISGAPASVSVGGRFVDAMTLVASVTFRGPTGCVWKATVTYRWGSRTPVKPPKTGPPTKTTPVSPPEQALECSSPQIPALVTSKGAVLPYEYGDKMPAGARAVCWPSVRAYKGGWKESESYQGQSACCSASETAQALGSGTWKLSTAFVDRSGAMAYYNAAAADVVGSVSGQNSKNGESCKYEGSGRLIAGDSLIIIRVGPPGKPQAMHKVKGGGSGLKAGYQCSDGRAFTADHPYSPKVDTGWTPLRSWRALSGAETRQGHGPYLEGGGMGPLAFKVSWSFKAKS